MAWSASAGVHRVAEGGLIVTRTSSRANLGEDALRCSPNRSAVVASAFLLMAITDLQNHRQVAVSAAGLALSSIAIRIAWSPLRAGQQQAATRRSRKGREMPDVTR